MPMPVMPLAIAICALVSWTNASMNIPPAPSAEPNTTTVLGPMRRAMDAATRPVRNVATADGSSSRPDSVTLDAEAVAAGTRASG